MHDPFDVSLDDYELLTEVELTTNLIIAANEADSVLAQPAIDQLLGLGPELRVVSQDSTQLQSQRGA